MTFDVVGVGHGAVDYLGVVERYPELDSKVELSEFSMQGGGPVATALATLAILGVKTTFIGKISDDDFGQFIQQGLREADVDLSGLVIEPGRVSPFSFVSVDRKTAKRTVFWTRGDVAPLREKEIHLDLFDQARILHVDGLQMESQISAALHAKGLGMQVVYDAGSPRMGMHELMKLTDVLIASETFATEVVGGALPESLKALQSKGPRTVVITIGPEGSVGLEEEHSETLPAFDIHPVDTTGAGDVYHGAFIYGLLQGWDLRRKMLFANAAAGLKCRVLGGRAGIPSLQEIEQFLKKTGS